MIKTQDTLKIESVNLRKAAQYFRAINHPLRKEILRLLHQNEFMTVSSIYTQLKIEQSVCSQHLGVLREANLVVAKRTGKLKFYTVNYRQIDYLHRVAAVLENAAGVSSRFA